MKVKLRGKSVDVAGKICISLPCFYLFSDKGTFAPGRGYMSYHTKEHWCCGTRHLHGCPVIAVCKQCRLCKTSHETVDKCSCGSTDFEVKK